VGTADPASASEALEMVHAGLGWLAAADATALAGETQARCLQGLEEAYSPRAAAAKSGCWRSHVLGCEGSLLYFRALSRLSLLTAFLKVISY
jgi:hypothetical protein